MTLGMVAVLSLSREPDALPAESVLARDDFRQTGGVVICRS